MVHNVSIYLDEEAHRLLKAKASRMGVSLSAFVARAALDALRQPTRREASATMDRLRGEVAARFTPAEVRETRDTGRA